MQDVIETLGVMLSDISDQLTFRRSPFWSELETTLEVDAAYATRMLTAWRLPSLRIKSRDGIVVGFRQKARTWIIERGEVAALEPVTPTGLGVTLRTREVAGEPGKRELSLMLFLKRAGIRVADAAEFQRATSSVLRLVAWRAAQTGWEDGRGAFIGPADLLRECHDALREQLNTDPEDVIRGLHAGFVMVAPILERIGEPLPPWPSDAEGLTLGVGFKERGADSVLTIRLRNLELAQ